MLPSPKQFSDTLKLYNIKKSSRVVVYNSLTNPYAPTRVYWMLKAYGVLGVSVLNGGLQKWIADKRPVEGEPNPGVEEDYAVALNADLLKTYEQIIALEGEGSADA